ncbi:hypothetical protein SARC_16839, partial [Sphaeroforma arctica JP610]
MRQPSTSPQLTHTHTHPADPLHIPTTSADPEGLVIKAVLSGDYPSAIQACLDTGKLVEALAIASLGSVGLLHRTRLQVLSKSESNLNRILHSVCMQDLNALVVNCDLVDWRECLAMLCYHASADQ